MAASTGWSSDEIVKHIEDNWFDGAEQWRSGSRGEILREPDMTCLFAPVACSAFNLILRTRIDPAHLEERIEWVAAQSKARGVPVSWCIGPRTCPMDLITHLESKGFRGETVAGMAADLPISGQLPTDLEIVEVTDRKTCQAWNRVFSTVYSFPESAAAAWGEMAFRTTLTRNGPWRNFLGSLGDEPVAAACVFVNSNTAALAGVATREEFRHRGFAAAVSLAALQFAHDRGCQLATLFASNEGENLYRKLGFRKYCVGACYSRSPR
jgi:acetyltransferase (GNAT) family protein